MQTTWAVWAVVLVAVGGAVGKPSHHHDDVTKAQNRDEKFFVTILKISPDQCTTTSTTNTLGTCLPSADCTTGGGVAAGTCAKGFGVCCNVQRTCGTSTSYNNTYFVNPGYSGTDTGTNGACTLTVNRASNNICQMRLDFIDFELGQPDVNGNCNQDFLTVTGGTSTPPTICGSNTGQHMYVDVDPNGGALNLVVDRMSTSTANRKWNINVTQIPCDSQYRAPAGCLQYYTGTTGVVESFNYNNNLDASSTNRQINNQDYAVCVEMAPGYCGIQWTQNPAGGTNAFTVSGGVDSIDPSLIGTPDASSTGAACLFDYVLIPGATDDSTGTSVDRYCGLGFPTSATSTSKPFMMYVRTNADETTGLADSQNRGFSLMYRQLSTC